MNKKTCIFGLVAALQLNLFSQYTWQGAYGAYWGDSTSWTPSGLPNSSTATALFTNYAGVSINVDTDESSYSVGTMSFSSTNPDDPYTLDGAGTLNVYTSITDLGTGGLGSISCTLNLEGDVAFDIADGGAIQFFSPISGPGGITLNAGMLYFTNSSPPNYTGTTTINAGYFEAGSADVFSHNSAFVLADSSDAFLTPGGSNQTIGSLAGGATSSVGLLGSILTIGNDNTSTEYDGVISDGGGNPYGGIIKIGTGTLILGGANSYTGDTTVSGGILELNGANTFLDTATVSVSSGQLTLGNNSALGNASLIVTDAATVALNNGLSVRTISAAFDPDSTFEIAITPTAAASLLVTDTAALGGTVKVVPAAGTYSSHTQYPIIEASHIRGAFNPTVVGSPPGTTFELSQIGNILYLLFGKQQISTTGLSGNALKVANYLNKHAETDTIALLEGLSGTALKNALNSVSPARNAFGTYVAEQIAFSFSNLLTTHIDTDLAARESVSKQDLVASLFTSASKKAPPIKVEKPKSKFSGWVSGFGEFAHQRAQNQNPSFNFISEAVVAGFDYHLKKKDLIGAALGYAHTHFYDKGAAGFGNINYYFASAYGYTSIKQFYLSPAVWGIFNENSNTRKVLFPGFSKSAKAHIFAWQFVPHLESGYQFKYNWGNLTPFASADWAINWQRSYREKGAHPFNASQRASNSSMVRSEAGLRFCERWQGDQTSFILKEKLSYVFEKPFGVGTVNTAFVGTPSSFTVEAVNHSLNLAAVGLDFLVAFGEERSWLIDLSYNGEFGSSYMSNDLILNLTKHF